MVLDVNIVLTGKQLGSIMGQKTASNVEAELAQVFTSREREKFLQFLQQSDWKKFPPFLRDSAVRLHCEMDHGATVE